jgi:hypothetical protein
MTSLKDKLGSIGAARAQILALITDTATSIQDPTPSSHAKQIACSLIIHLAAAAADLTRLRRELSNPKEAH